MYDATLLRAYFYRLCERLDMVLPYPDRAMTERVLRWHLHRRVVRTLRSFDTEDVRQWLSVVLLVDFVVRLEGVAVGLRVLPPQLWQEEGVFRVSTEPFERARRELGMERYCFVVLSPLNLPEADQALQGLYEALGTGRLVETVHFGRY